jgi:hypothetical protein
MVAQLREFRRQCTEPPSAKKIAPGYQPGAISESVAHPCGDLCWLVLIVIVVAIVILVSVPALLPCFLNLAAFLFGLLAVLTVLALGLAQLILQTTDVLLALVVAIGGPHRRCSSRHEEHGQGCGGQNLYQFA